MLHETSPERETSESTGKRRIHWNPQIKKMALANLLDVKVQGALVRSWEHPRDGYSLKIFFGREKGQKSRPLSVFNISRLPVWKTMGWLWERRSDTARGRSTGVAAATLKNSLATPAATPVGISVLKDNLWLIGHLGEKVSNVWVQVNIAQDASLVTPPPGLAQAWKYDWRRFHLNGGTAQNEKHFRSKYWRNEVRYRLTERPSVSLDSAWNQNALKF